MNDNLVIAVISSGSAIVGGVIGSLISLFTAKLSADREDKRRMVEIERGAATERIDNLYEPLLGMMTPRPPYDEFYFDRQMQIRIIECIDKNNIYASQDLLKVYYNFAYAAYNHPEKIDRGLDWEIYNVVIAEHNSLKQMLGYTNLLGRKYRVKKRMESYREFLDRYWRRIKRSRIYRKMSFRRRRRRRH